METQPPEESKPKCTECNGQLKFSQKLQLLTIRRSIICKTCETQYKSDFSLSSDQALSDLLVIIVIPALILFAILLITTFGFPGGLIIGIGMFVLITSIIAYVLPIQAEVNNSNQ